MTRTPGLAPCPPFDVVEACREFPDLAPHRHRFGFEHLVIERRVRAELKAAGLLDEHRLHFAVADRMKEYWGSKPSYAEVSEARRLRYEAKWARSWAAGESSLGVMLTKPEMEHLAELLDRANDEVGQAILAKVLEKLR